MTTEAITPLRQRMIEDMNARKLCAGTQRGHIRSCKQFAAFLKRSPETATFEDIRRFQLHLAETGVSICTRNVIMTGLRFTEQARQRQRSGSTPHDPITADQRSPPELLLLACSPPQPSSHSDAQFAHSRTRKQPAQPTARSFTPTRSH
jgi:integrase/recombinase XerD